MSLLLTIVGIALLLVGLSIAFLAIISMIFPSSRLTWSEWLVLAVLIAALMLSGIASIVLN